MKTLFSKYINKKSVLSILIALPLGGVGGGLLSSCTVDDVLPQGTLDQSTAYSEPDNLMTTAYAALGDDWYSYPFNLWPYGDMSADDCLKGGSGENDTGYHPMEIFSTLQPDRGEFDELWYRLYVAISRCNEALKAIESNNALDEVTKYEDIAEMKFLRGHFYYKLQQMWYNVPLVTENLSKDDIENLKNNFDVNTSDETDVKRYTLTIKNMASLLVSNANIEDSVNAKVQEITNGIASASDKDQYYHKLQCQAIISEFKKAYDNLDEYEAGKTGRAHKVAAAAYLAKCYLNFGYGDGYEANTGYDHVDKAMMQKVVEYTSLCIGKGYDYLDTYGNIFLQDYKNSSESIFAVQHSNKADDGTTYGRANWSDMLNGVWGVWSCGWDFHKPSQNLINAFRTKNGLPMSDDPTSSNYFDNDHNTYPVNGSDSKYKYDPRLFHTVGMPTYPYKYESTYTLTKANSRTPNTYGYYCSMKEVPQRSKGEYYDNPWQAFGQNDYVLRYTDVMLMRAEALIELDQYNGDAKEIINTIRRRAKKDISSSSLVGYAKDQCDIAEYGNFASKDDARAALRWERRVELAMEHHRFFDLRRWGLLSETLNQYFKSEVNDEYDGQTYALYLKDAFFTAGKNEYFPIANNQINYVTGLYTQNKGY